MNKSQFEDLPNELFYFYGKYLTFNDLLKSFFNLNTRYNQLLFDLNNLFYEINSNVSQQEIETKYFQSKLKKLIVNEISVSVSISNRLNQVECLILYRPIRINNQLLISLKNLKINLTNIRTKRLNKLFSLIFSNEFICLTKLQILHQKSFFIGFSKFLIDSVQQPSLTLKEFIFDIEPTLEWNVCEHFIKFLPNLQRLCIKKLNTRSKWSCLHFGQILKQYLTNLNDLFIKINFLNQNNNLFQQKICQDFHPLFKYIQSNKVNSKKPYSTIIINSNI